MLNFLIFCGLVYLAFKSKPNKQSFQDFLDNKLSNTSTTTSSKGLKSWIPSFLGLTGRSGGRKVQFDYKDNLLFALATIMPSRVVYIGIFGTWFELYNPRGYTTSLNSGSSSNSGCAELVDVIEHDYGMAMAEQEKELAVQAKARKDYDSAYNHFCKAAQSLIQSQSKFNQLEAGQLFEEASKCVKLKDFERALKALKQAGAIYEMHDFGRSARVFDAVGDLEVKQGRPVDAEEAYGKAVEFYQRADDQRHLSVLQKLAAAQCQSENFPKAIETFKQLVDEPSLQFQRKYFVLSISLIYFSTSNWAGVATFVRDVESSYPHLTNEREFQIIQKILSAVNEGRECGDTIQFLTSLLKDQWQVKAVQQLSKHLESSELS